MHVEGSIDPGLVEQAAFDLYAAGPWGKFHAFADGGVRAICDAHTMDVYRGMARSVLETALFYSDVETNGVRQAKLEEDGQTLEEQTAAAYRRAMGGKGHG
jgi:hypothetical protein